MSSFYTYLLIVNLIGAFVFYLDKQNSKLKKYRIPEKVLHLLEAAGAFPSILLLMYLLRHKNKKVSYWAITYLIALVWSLCACFILLDK